MSLQCELCLCRFDDAQGIAMKNAVARLTLLSWDLALTCKCHTRENPILSDVQQLPNAYSSTYSVNGHPQGIAQPTSDIDALVARPSAGDYATSFEPGIARRWCPRRFYLGRSGRIVG